MTFKMNGWPGYQSSPLTKKDPSKMEIETAKNLVRDNVGNTTVDSPNYNESKFTESEKNIKKAVDILYRAGYDKEQVEQATGAGGYEAAMNWARTND